MKSPVYISSPSSGSLMYSPRDMKTFCTTSAFRCAITCATFRLTIIAVTVTGVALPVPQGPSDQQKQGPGPDFTVYRVGGDVTAPRPLSTPLPTPPARTDKQRRVVVSFVVTPDGAVRDVKIIKHFQPDFDRATIKTVATWRFEPATRGGKPVAVRLETEVKFTPQ